ncbi:MAG: signal recognition particle-docking protein FtsY [Actinomycetales bacterium]|nr:signal recognition particle-docking protein FtsY [Actinomycetales bacterium]
MFEQLWQIIALVVGIAIVGVGLVVGFLRSRGGKTRDLPTAPPSARTTTGYAGAPGDDIDSPSRPAAGATATDVLEPEVETEVPVEVIPEAPAYERPDSARGRLARLRARLARSNTAIGKGLPCAAIPRQTRTRAEGRPSVILVVGVNGTGKTTTVGKLARVLVAEDKDVILGAADTFRAAAADQLQTWGERVGVPTVRSDREGADPPLWAFDAVKAAAELEADVVIIDTAGRLHNKTNLMDELGKVKRVIEKQSPIDEVLLVLDATTGQNGLEQARVFASVVDVTGIVLTKLDGTAKGGIVVAVQRKLGVPVKLVGLGEGPDDLAPFDPAAFVDAILD